ncbi:MAG: M20 family metallo-hydrolase [Candidatus Methanoplasma sp.]|jgi:succinyl-diaminopimelate desuccinylase|nr:M20 family metallo-hydrolase [Candidatus Methanoplasma sp.]
MDLETVLEKIRASRDDMVSVMSDMIRIPAIAPVNGGDGESRRADMLMGLLEGYDSVVRDDAPDDLDPSVPRANIVARKNGRGRGTVWIVAHMDTVPAGDLGDWDSDPFEPVVRDGRIYGRGTEDNGQAILSSMFASKFIPKEILGRRSIGIAYVADEETNSKTGICHLIDKGYFTGDDVFIVPDWGTPAGDLLDVAEKNLVWLRFAVTGKSTHGSTPDSGINALRAGAELMADLSRRLEEEFPDRDPLFHPPRSTFEPTKCSRASMNVNTIPGSFEFSMDIRALPMHGIEEISAAARRIASEHAERTGAKIAVSEIQRHVSGRPSSVDGEAALALISSIEEVTGVRPRAAGVGGATCANFFRMKGYDSYVWEMGGGTLHGPNEYVVIDNMVTDALVFATLFYKLCV